MQGHSVHVLCVTYTVDEAGLENQHGTKAIFSLDGPSGITYFGTPQEKSTLLWQKQYFSTSKLTRLLVPWS